MSTWLGWPPSARRSGAPRPWLSFWPLPFFAGSSTAPATGARTADHQGEHKFAVRAPLSCDKNRKLGAGDNQTEGPTMTRIELNAIRRKLRELNLEYSALLRDRFGEG